MCLQTRSQVPLALAAALAAVTLAGCGPHDKAHGPSATTAVSVVTVRETSVPVTVELPGRTSPYLVAQVRARVDGIVQERNFEEGAEVQAGQALYRIDAAPFEAELNSALAAAQKAAANLAATQAQAQRYQVLVVANAVSRQAYDNAVAAQQQAAADLASAQAAAAVARLKLGYTRVAAPIAGRTGTSQVTQGAYVQASAATPLTTVQQIDPIYVDLNETSAAALQLRRDVADGRLRLTGPRQAKVTLVLEDGSAYPVAGQLQFIGTSVDPGTGSVRMRALFRNPDGILLPGMFVRAHVEQGVNDHALLVPVRAVGHDAKGQATAMVVDGGGQLAQRALQVQNMIGDAWVVTAGLRNGERVVVAGLQKVRPGMQVKAVEAAPSVIAQAAADANQQ